MGEEQSTEIVDGFISLAYEELVAAKRWKGRQQVGLE